MSVLDQAFMAAIKDALREVVREELAKSQRPSAEPEFLTLDAAADRAACSKGTVRGWLKNGALKSYGVGRIVRIRRLELDELLTKGEREDDEINEKANAIMGRLHRLQARAK